MKHYIRLDKFIYIFMILLTLGSGIDDAAAACPSFDGNKAAGLIEKLICGDDGLAALDRKLAEIYAETPKKAVNEHPPILKAKQRGWIKGRNQMFWEHQGEATIVRGLVPIKCGVCESRNEFM